MQNNTHIYKLLTYFHFFSQRVWVGVWSVIAIFILLFMAGCKRESTDFADVADVFFTIKNDLQQNVAGARIVVFSSPTDYENAIVTKLNTNATHIVTTDATGQARITLTPQTRYYFIVTYFDVNRNMNLSNIGISGQINPMPRRSNVYAEVVIKPEDGNLIFYSTAPAQLPISITVATSTNQTGRDFTLNAIYTLATPPNVLSNNVVRVLRDPGNYTYYAKSANGCAWTGQVSLKRGEVVLVDLSKCKSGVVSFYTPLANDTLLPMDIFLNRTDNIGQLITTRAFMDCTTDKANSLTTIKNAGSYTYLVRSRSGRCVWTGSFQVREDDCVVIPIDVCN